MKLTDKVLQVLLPKPVRGALRAMTRPLAVRMPRLGVLFYAFDGSFNREARGVLYGQMLFHRTLDSTSGEGGRYLLRRCVHRLEKGLIMRPQKGVFGEKYIADAVSLYAAHMAEVNGKSCDEGHRLLASWSGDVLRRYFQTVPVGGSKTVDATRAKFVEVEAHRPGVESVHAPYQRDLTDLPVDYPSMLKLAQRRRSVRWYLPKPVPREMIDKAIQVGGLSPSACNRQPFVFRIFDDPDLVKKVAAIPGGTAGFHQNFPVVVVLVGQLRAFPQERDRHVIYIDAALAAMAFQFALEAQGLSSCCINWQDIAQQEERMAAALSLEPDERPIMLISLGYPDPTGQVPYSMKKSLDELRSYNRT